MATDPEATDEMELIRACQHGQREAGVKLVDRYWDRVYAFAYRLSLNQADAEDIAQETFLRAFGKLNEFDPKGQFKAWLLKIAANLFLDARKSSKKKNVSTADMSEYAQHEPAVEQTLERKELLAALDQVLQTLTHEQRTVVLLRAVEHMEYPDIANMLQLKESTVRWHMYEARRILWQKLSKKFDLEAMGNE